MDKPFQRGVSNDGNGGGRRAGSRNKLQTDFLEALAADFAEHGAGVIRIARVEKPIEWLKLIASVLPKEIVLEQSVLVDLERRGFGRPYRRAAAHARPVNRCNPETPLPADETSTKCSTLPPTKLRCC